MYTRCKDCHTVYPVNAALLARAGGRFRCGKCNKTGDALEALFDEWPAAGARPPERGDLPVLGIQLDLERAARSRLEGDEAGDDASGPTPGNRSWLMPVSWIGGAVLLAAVVGWQLLSYFGDGSEGDSAWQSALISLGLAEAPPTPPARDLTRIEVVNRQLAEHPQREGKLSLAATIVNRARHQQPFPRIEVLMLDASGRIVARQGFSPADYLADSDSEAGFAAGAWLPLTLELDDPGPSAVGFELRFE